MRGIAATCELWVDGVRYPDAPTLAPLALSNLKVTWGRDNTLDQPDPAQCQFTVVDPGGVQRINDTVTLGSTVAVWSELDGERVMVFGGRVTDIDISWDDQAGFGVGDIIAADQLTDLANRFVGAEPWALEPALQRATRILTAVGVDPAGLDMPERPAAVQVSRKDVDRQPAAGLLSELAQTTATVLWSAYDVDGPYLRYEDPTARASLRTFERDPDTGLWRPMGSGGGFYGELSSHVVLRDPVVFTRAVTDLITRVAVRWRDQSTTPDTTERSETVISDAAELAYGARGLSLTTDLVSSSDALKLANAVLAGHQPTEAWRMAGLTWDLRDAVVGVLTNLPINPAPATATGWLPNSGAQHVHTFNATDRCIDVDRQAAAGADVAASWYNAGNLMPYNPVFPAGVEYQRSIEIWVDQAATLNNTGLGGSGFTTTALPANTWTTVVQRFTGTGAAYGALSGRVDIPGVGTGVHVKLRRAMVVAVNGPHDVPYFDGSTPDTGRVEYAWTGAADASTSTATGTEPALALALLGNTTRAGLPVTLTDLPYWTPNADAIQLYIEGGQYTYENRWVLDLNASPSTGIGASMSYEETDRTIRFVDVDPTVTYLDMTGVGPGQPA